MKKAVQMASVSRARLGGCGMLLGCVSELGAFRGVALHPPEQAHQLRPQVAVVRKKTRRFRHRKDQDQRK